jgi:hypothetical protein
MTTAGTDNSAANGHEDHLASGSTVSTSAAPSRDLGFATPS